MAASSAESLVISLTHPPTLNHIILGTGFWVKWVGLQQASKWNYITEGWHDMPNVYDVNKFPTPYVQRKIIYNDIYTHRKKAKSEIQLYHVADFAIYTN